MKSLRIIFLILSLPVLIMPQVGCSSEVFFGEKGQSGVSGEEGIEGEPGKVQHIKEGQEGPLKVVAVGKKGTPGRKGGAGKNAKSCLQKKVAMNTIGGSGGAGGDGGPGGDGGQGGDLYFYFSDLEKLKNIRAYNLGSTGGLGGPPGKGGQPCLCQFKYWTLEENGVKSHYRCRDGRKGPKGRWGRSGKKGRDGNIFILPKGGATEISRPKTYTLNSIEKGKNFVFSESSWVLKDGATSLFHPESQIQNQYYLKNNQVLARVSFSKNLKNLPLPLQLELRNGEPQITLKNSPQKIFLSLKEKKNAIEWIINPLGTYSKSKLQKTRVIDLYLDGENSYIHLKDPKALPKQIQTLFSLKLEGEKGPMKTIPESLGVRKEGNYYLNLGRFDFPTDKAKVHFYLGLKKSFKGKILSQEIFRLEKEMGKKLKLVEKIGL